MPRTDPERWVRSRLSVVSGTVLVVRRAHDGRPPGSRAAVPARAMSSRALDLPDADLLVTGLPGTRVEIRRSSPTREVIDQMTQRVRTARQADATC